MPTNYDMLNLPDNRVDIQDLQRILGGHTPSPMPPPLQEMQRQDQQRMIDGLKAWDHSRLEWEPLLPRPNPQRILGGMPQGPPNLPGTGMAMVPPMPNTPLQTGPQFGMGQAPMSPPSRPQPWRPLGQFPAIKTLRPGPATVGQSTVNSTAQHRPRGSQSMAPPAPQRGGLGIGGLGMESPDPQRQGTGFMSGDLAWTTPQRPSGPSYYEGLMPGSTYSPMEQQRRR